MMALLCHTFSFDRAYRAILHIFPLLTFDSTALEKDVVVSTMPSTTSNAPRLLPTQAAATEALSSNGHRNKGNAARDDTQS